ncbi:TPA: hypothetical protein EYP66_10615, partial [Candidatus Poribacteria bacterium]|nr:hypothetical protein [Candidatus Poribacteria bacterium]
YFLNFRTFSFFKTNVSGSKMAKTLLSFSYPLILSFFLKQTQNRVDTILLGVFTSSTQVGLYNAALPISQTLSIFLQSVLFMFAPIIAELYAQRKYNELKFIYKSVTKIILYLSLIPFLIMLFFPKSLLTLLFGKNYDSATGVLRILLFAFFINSIFGPVGSMLINIKKTRHYMLGDLIGVFTSIALSLILIPRLGISGAAYGILAYMFLANSIRLLSVYHYLKIQPFDINYLIIPVSVGLVVFILRQLLDTYLGVHELVILFICAVSISFFILVFAYRDFTKQGFNLADLVGEIRKKRI